MKGRRVFFIAVACLFVVMAAAMVYHDLGVPLRGRAKPRPFTINRGETLDEVLDRLESEEIVRSARPLRFYARLRGWDRRVRAGRYMIGAGMPAAEILQTLVEGPRLLQKVTLPEGLPLREAFAILSDSLKIPDVSLEGVSGDTTWLLSLDLPVPNLEGYLYPETYHFDPGTSERIVIEHLVTSALEFFTPEKIQRAEELGMSIHEVMTLASIVEAEAKVPEERSRISAVFHRRLDRGVPLQADPTVQYAVGKMGEPLTTDDLSVPSPYNTYLIQGLPPGPINSPGAASLDAALWPLESCDDFYFVARPDGSHIFSRTLREHEAARQTVRRLKRQSPGP